MVTNTEQNYRNTDACTNMLQIKLGTSRYKEIGHTHN